MAAPVATVFGGTGFLGGRIVESLLRAGYDVRVAARHPDAAAATGGRQRITPIPTDIRDDRAVADALSGADAAVNAVGSYVERGGVTFEAIHVDGAHRVAETAHRVGVRNLVHISGIGADRHASSRYVRSRAEGEIRVRQAFPEAKILRPCVMFGHDDTFLTTLKSLTSRFPVIPLFGRGRTRLQPVFVGDVAAAVAQALAAGSEKTGIFELGGPEIFRYRDLLRLVARQTGHRPVLVPVPFALWHILAAGASWLPDPPLTPAQVALMRHDNVAARGTGALPAFGVTQTAIEEVLHAAFRRIHDEDHSTGTGP